MSVSIHLAVDGEIAKASACGAHLFSRIEKKTTSSNCLGPALMDILAAHAAKAKGAYRES